MAGIDIVAGTVAKGLLQLRVTNVPANSAAPRRVTVPVVEVPPRTAAGLKLSFAIGTGLIVNTALPDWPRGPVVAVIVASVCEATADVVIVN